MKRYSAMNKKVAILNTQEYPKIRIRSFVMIVFTCIVTKIHCISPIGSAETSIYTRIYRVPTLEIYKTTKNAIIVRAPFARDVV